MIEQEFVANAKEKEEKTQKNVKSVKVKALQFNLPKLDQECTLKFKKSVSNVTEKETLWDRKENAKNVRERKSIKKQPRSKLLLRKVSIRTRPSFWRDKGTKSYFFIIKLA